MYRLGPAWQGVVPNYVTDTAYYSVQIKEAADGLPLTANPFFLEHNRDRAPAFFLANAIAALPMRLGSSFAVGLLIGLAIANVLLIWLLYILFKRLGVSERWSLVLPFVVYADVYGMMVRPVIMSLVLPALTFFYLALWRWLEDHQSKKNQLLLVAATVLSFYIYPYLYQIVTVTLGLVFIYLVFGRDLPKVKSFFKILSFMLAGILPSVIYTWQTASQPFYWDWMRRMSYLSTHLPSPETYYYGRWFILMMPLWIFLFVLRRWQHAHQISWKVFNYFTIAGAAIFVVLISNVLTGRDFDIGNHVNRFLIFWFSLSLAAISYFTIAQLKLRQLRLWQKIVLLGLFGVTGSIFLRQIPRSVFVPFQTDMAQAKYIQTYKEPIEWLDRDSQEFAVVWANGGISNYVPVFSKHYVLFPGMLNFLVYLTPSPEVEERYLISRYFETPDRVLLEKEFSFYGGVGLEYERRNASWKSTLCRNLRLDLIIGDCGRFEREVQQQTDKEKKTLVDKMLGLNIAIRLQIYQELKKYHVAYIVKDLSRDLDWHPEKIKNTLQVYNNGKFAVFRVN